MRVSQIYFPTLTPTLSRRAGEGAIHDTAISVSMHFARSSKPEGASFASGTSSRHANLQGASEEVRFRAELQNPKSSFGTCCTLAHSRLKS